MLLSSRGAPVVFCPVLFLPCFVLSVRLRQKYRAVPLPRLYEPKKGFKGYAFMVSCPVPCVNCAPLCHRVRTPHAPLPSAHSGTQDFKPLTIPPRKGYTLPLSLLQSVRKSFLWLPVRQLFKPTAQNTVFRE